MTPAGIEPATFQFVAQHLNYCATNTLHKGGDDNVRPEMQATAQQPKHHRSVASTDRRTDRQSLGPVTAVSSSPSCQVRTAYWRATGGGKPAPVPLGQP